MPSLLQLVQTMAVWALPVLFAVTLHEVAHGWAARALGDNTARMMGRLSLNPLKHVDPVGTIVVPIVLLVLQAGFLFGWAKPVPVSSRNLKHPRRDMALVAFAGPMANLAMAFAWGLVYKLALAGDPSAGFWIGLKLTATAGITINLVIMALNLLPLPPLDGGRVLAGLVPSRVAHQLDRIEPYGMLILVTLIVLKLLGPILYPIISVAQTVLFAALDIR